MTLLAPLGLALFVAVPAIVVLWLLHSRFRSERVPSLLLWQDVPAPVLATRAWRLPRLELLLILQIAAAAALAAALSRPAVDVAFGRHIALVLDSSVSMQAQDVSPSRFEAARQQLVDVARNAGPADRFSLVIADTQPRVVVRDESSAAVLSALQQASPSVVEGGADLGTALQVVAAPKGISEVVVATDGSSPLDLPPQTAPISFRLVGGQPDQLALSDVSVRQPIDGSQRLAGFASVANFGAASRSTDIRIIADSVLVDSQAITVDPHARTEVTFTLPTSTRGLRVMLSETDSVAADKRVDLAAPAQFARSMLVVSDQPGLWEHVLASAAQITTRSISPSGYSISPPTSGEVVLFEGWVPPDLPDTERILVNPPDRPGVLVRQATDPHAVAIHELDRVDPLLHGLDLSTLTVLETGRAPVPEWSSLTVGSADDFALGHGLLNGRRTVILAFDPATSNLAQLAAFPLLVANAVDWLAPGRGDIAHAGLGPAVDITPHVLQPIPAQAAAPRTPDWFELWPHHGALALLLLAAEFGLAYRRGLVRRPPVILSAVAALGVGIALLQPGIWLPDRALAIVLAVDRSASISSESQSALANWLAEAARLKPTTDRVEMVDFGSPDGTDIAQALRTAGALVRGQGPARLVLVSDGQATTGNLESALKALGGMPVDVVPLDGQPAPPAVVLESLDVPRYVRASDSFDATLSVGSTGSANTSLQVSIDGKLLKDQPVALGPGHTQMTLTLSIDGLGFHRIRITSGSTSVEGFVTVKPPEHVMVVEERPGESAGILAALKGSGSPGTFEVRPPGAIGSLSQLEPYDAVVLANVSATSFTLDQQRTLRTFVQERGRGLVALGGQTSFVLGDYEGSVLEQVLPVLSSIPPRREDARLALLLVIDISQSMDRVVDGVSGIDMAKQAATLATRALRDDDQVGVLIFNHRFSWLAPIAKVSDIGRADLENKIASLTPSGGNEIFAALDEGSTAMRAITADLRHIVLFTDGNSRDSNDDALTSQLRQDKIGLSTVGLGPEADTKLLAKLAKDGQGRFYYSDRPRELPRILAREVAIAKRSFVVEGSILPRLVSPSPILRAIVPDDVPLLGGYISTTPKTNAQVVLGTADDKPLLAQWRIGLGRAVAWTSDVGGPWTRQWADWSAAPRLWRQAVGWAAGEPVQPDFLLDVSQTGITAHITLDDLREDQFVDLASPVATITAPSGSDSSVALRQTAPGRYEVTVLADTPGTYAVSVAEGARTETNGFVIRQQPELSSFGADRYTLRRIASDSGGRVLSTTNAAEAFRDDGRAISQRWQPLWQPLLLVALLLFVASLAARRLSLAWRASVSLSKVAAGVAGGVRRRSGPRRVRR